jgi:hypothetical protein
MVAAVCLLVAGISAYGRYAIVDQARFADRAATTLQSDEVRDEIAARTARRVVAERPVLEPDVAVVDDAVKEELTGDPAFQGAFRIAAAQLHQALFVDPGAEASLVVGGSGAALHRALADRMPDAAHVPRLDDPSLMSIGAGGSEHALRELAPVGRDLALPTAVGFGLLGLMLLAAGVILAGDRRSAVRGAALAVAAAGGLAAAGVIGARDIVLTRFDTGFGDTVVSQIWSAYLGDLRASGLAVAAAGLVIAAAVGGPRPSPALTPRTRPGLAARAAALLALAALAVTVPELLVHVGLVTVAALFVYVAVGDLVRALSGDRGERRLDAELPEHHERVPVDGPLQHGPVVVAGGDDRAVGLGPAPGRR